MHIAFDTKIYINITSTIKISNRINIDLWICNVHAFFLYTVFILGLMDFFWNEIFVWGRDVSSKLRKNIIIFLNLYILSFCLYFFWGGGVKMIYHWLHNCCLQVLTVHGIELCQYRDDSTYSNSNAYNFNIFSYAVVKATSLSQWSIDACKEHDD